MRGGGTSRSRPGGVLPEQGRWAAIESSWPSVALHSTGDLEHPAEEGLVLNRFQLGDRTVLVACSVLPGGDYRSYWARLPDVPLDQLGLVLNHHVGRIVAERRRGELMIWGGDFNQPLIPPFSGGSA